MLSRQWHVNPFRTFCHQGFNSPGMLSNLTVYQTMLTCVRHITEWAAIRSVGVPFSLHALCLKTSHNVESHKLLVFIRTFGKHSEWHARIRQVITNPFPIQKCQYVLYPHGHTALNTCTILLVESHRMLHCKWSGPLTLPHVSSSQPTWLK